jgi:hypothetical protein
MADEKEQSLALPKGAQVTPDQLVKVSDGLAALENDPHAPRKVSIDVTLHVHNEYPKLVYKETKHGVKTETAKDEAAEKELVAAGFSVDAPKPPAEAAE